jgi:hypothetical protein
MPTTPTSDSVSASGTELPEPVTNALDEIETGLPTVTPTDQPERRARTDEVISYLQRQIREPIPRALLSRPKIFAWCLDRALAQTDPDSVGAGSGSFRRAEPLVDEPTEATPAPPAERSTTPSTRRKGSKS